VKESAIQRGGRSSNIGGEGQDWLPASGSATTFLWCLVPGKCCEVHLGEVATLTHSCGRGKRRELAPATGAGGLVAWAEESGPSAGQGTGRGEVCGFAF